MNLKEFSRASGHVQEHFQTPLNVSDVAKDGFLLTSRELEINVQKTVNGMRYGISTSVGSSGCATVYEAVEVLRKRFDEAVEPQRRMTSEPEPKPIYSAQVAEAIALLREYPWRTVSPTVNAFCDGMTVWKNEPATFETERYIVTITPKTTPTAEGTENGN